MALVSLGGLQIRVQFDANGSTQTSPAFRSKVMKLASTDPMLLTVLATKSSGLQNE